MKHLIILFCVVFAMPMYAQDADLSEIYTQMESIKLQLLNKRYYSIY